MTPNERRAEIMRLLVARRMDTAPRLAAELGVNVKTIRRDVLQLMTEYPLETVQGHAGCVRVADWYHPHRNILSGEQAKILSQMMGMADDNQKKVLREMLMEYGSAAIRQTMKEAENAG